MTQTMKTIKEIMDKLPPAHRTVLYYAFEHGISHFVEIEDGSAAEKQFIGVNVTRISNLKIEQQAGVWASGIIKGK